MTHFARRIVTGGVLLLAFLPPTAGAHVGTVLFPIYELPTSDLPILGDGTLADWEEVLPGPSATSTDFYQTAESFDPLSPDDLAASVYLAWHGASQRLFCAVYRLDDVYINAYPGGDPLEFWRYDSIEFLVDGDHSGDLFYLEGDKDVTNAQAQMYVAIAESPDNRILNLLSAATWAREPPWAEAKGFVVTEVPHISGIELYATPWDDLNWRGPEQSARSALWAGKVIGVQVALADFDEQAGVYDSYTTLLGQEQVWNDASHFVDGLLVGCDYGDCGGAVEPEPSAVTAVSWARIKAGFR